MRTERPTCRECACTKVCEYFENENERNLDETCPLCNWENYFVEKSEWISVEDKLPTKTGKYLVFQKTMYVEHIDIVYYDTNYMGHSEEMGGRAVWFLFDSDWGDYEIGGVTHWMPLPEAPKMKDGE